MLIYSSIHGVERHLRGSNTVTQARNPYDGCSTYTYDEVRFGRLDASGIGRTTKRLPCYVRLETFPASQFSRWTGADPDSSPPAIQRMSFEGCRQVLLRAFGLCSDKAFQQLSCTISCVLSSARPLNVTELQAAVKIFFVALRQERLVSSVTVKDFTIWLRKFEPLFKWDDGGYVSFGQSEMQYFLRNFCIQGIDASHRTIAIICLEQIELQSSVEGWDSMEGEGCAFSRYATQYWRYHHQIARKTSLFLKYNRTRRKMSRSGETSKASSVSDSATTSHFGSTENVQNELESFNLDNDSQEWVFIKS